MFCYANIGVPKNPNNPFYKKTDPTTNPHGYNPLGTNLHRLRPRCQPQPGPRRDDVLQHDPGRHPPVPGAVQDPERCATSDKRPYPTFVKAYMHNGVFKSLQEVVHFYNTRNIAVNATGQEVAFDLRNRATPAGLHAALLPPPEVLDNVQNVAGYTPAQAAAAGGHRCDRRRTARWATSG